MLRGSGKRHILKSPDMKLPYDMSSFLRNGQNKETLFNLIERFFTEEKEKLGDRVVYFSNKDYILKILFNGALEIPEKASDHEEADTKLVAL